ncbi:predicted protein [Pyrenophora tritici-repentis Pt-1C-BFP]|uniref:Uncharacterized protein n=1 Tax=Pyrenophora tritici-repentis (strain Pt-1C-BFP) TaxID=426418 RepID=B2VUH6_PYRTR|nr:uncharacterized protein PTRG_01032 [Pyrenophora tritici-repentis Pt-1C-BFP]EDU40470.1 predicted protein [Pyrenophora tritici-repentis Pt-1C-BFP]
MRLIIASPAIFALALASSPIKPRQSPDPVHTVDACCGPPAPGPVGAPANWCQDRWGKNTYCKSSAWNLRISVARLPVSQIPAGFICTGDALYKKATVHHARAGCRATQARVGAFYLGLGFNTMRLPPAYWALALQKNVVRARVGD